MKYKNFKDFLEKKGIKATEEGKNPLEGKSAEEVAALYNEYNDAKQKELEEAIEEKATKADIKAIEKTIQENMSEQLKTLNGILKSQGVQIKKLTAAEQASEAKSWKEQLRENLTKNIDKLKALKNRDSAAKDSQFSFDIKAVADMTTPTHVTGQVPQSDRIPGLNGLPSRELSFLSVLGKRSTSSTLVEWVEKRNQEGAAGQTAEGITKNQIDFDLVLESEKVKKTTAFIKITTEMIDDIDWIMSEVENELMVEVLEAVEQTSYDGDGTGENHTGVATSAAAFAAGSFALAVDNANEVDVLVVAANQIKVAREGNRNAGPNYIFMHPTDVTRLKLEKLSSTDKRYVERLMTVGSTLLMDGIPIIETTLVTEGDYLIGNFDKALLVTKSAFGFDIGLDGNDFTKNFRTVLGEWRGLTIVKTNDANMFVAGTFATDKSALETA